MLEVMYIECADGTIYWNDTQKLMTCPEGQLALAEHLKHDMFYDVFSHDCVKNVRAAWVALCQSDNFDSAFALGETYMQLLWCIHPTMAAAKPPVGNAVRCD